MKIFFDIDDLIATGGLLLNVIPALENISMILKIVAGFLGVIMIGYSIVHKRLQIKKLQEEKKKEVQTITKPHSPNAND